MKIYIAKIYKDEISYLRIVNDKLRFYFNYSSKYTTTESSFNLKGKLIKDFFYANDADIINDTFMDYMNISEETYEEIIIFKKLKKI